MTTTKAHGSMPIRPALARRRIVLHAVRRARRAGFSLLELVVTLSIIATLAAIAAPRYHGSITRHRVDLAAARVVSDLELAARTAALSGASIRVFFDVDAETYELRDVPDPDRGTEDTEVALGMAPYRVDLVSASFGGRDAVEFDGLGQPGEGGTVRLKLGVFEREVVLDVSSRRAMVR